MQQTAGVTIATTVSYSSGGGVMPQEIHGRRGVCVCVCGRGGGGHFSALSPHHIPRRPPTSLTSGRISVSVTEMARSCHGNSRVPSRKQTWHEHRARQKYDGGTDGRGKLNIAHSRHDTFSSVPSEFHNVCRYNLDGTRCGGLPYVAVLRCRHHPLRDLSVQRLSND